MEASRLDILWRRYTDGDITKEERQELFRFIALAESGDAIGEKIIAEWTRINDGQVTILKWLSREAADEVFDSILNTKEEAQVVQIGQRWSWIKWVAAAAIVGVLATGAVMLYLGVPANDRHQQTAITHDVPAPSNTRAVITLADGTKVYLDSAGNGTIAQQNNVAVIKNGNGEIVYAAAGAGGVSPAGGGARRAGVDMNTLSNPRGSKVISLTLSDGTRVWLNSQSSLKYPTAFTATTREVEITGEAYFEVKHNSKQPFKVHLPNGSIVEDVGTSFNVNAYSDENDIKTTLIEGSVKLSPAGEPVPPQREGDRKRPRVVSGVVLKPGEQALLTTDHSPLTIHHPDLESVLAWKNGLFKMSKTDIGTIMRQLQRWYDVEVVYENGIPIGTLSGEVPRNMNLSEVLKVLEYSGMHFDIQGKRIIVRK